MEKSTDRHIQTYLLIFAALMALLAVTLLVARVDLGPWNLFIAMSIAVVKALLVLLFFMHVRDSHSMIWVFAGAGFFWFLLALVLLFTDYLTRGI